MRVTAFLIGVFAVSPVFAAVDPAPAPEPPRTSAFARSVWDVLEVRHGERDLLEPLAEILGRPDPKTDAPPDASVAKLLQALDGGVDLKVTTAALLAGAVVGNEFGGVPVKGWKYGNVDARAALARSLWSSAAALAPANPNEAKRRATAAIAIASLDGGMMSGTVIKRIVTDPNFATTSLLDAATADKLKRLIQDQDAQGSRFARAYTSALQAIWKLAGGPFPLAKSDVTATLAALTAARERADDPLALYKVVDITWRFLNAARAAKDEETRRSIEAYITAWKKTSAADPPVAAWLSQALETAGPPPQTGPRRP